MKAHIPPHREFIISFPDTSDEDRNDEAWEKLSDLLEIYKKNNPRGVYSPTFIEDCIEGVDALKDEYGFEYTIELR